jgi:hypothetical protein
MYAGHVTSSARVAIEASTIIVSVVSKTCHPSTWNSESPVSTSYQSKVRLIGISTAPASASGVATGRTALLADRAAVCGCGRAERE